MPRCRSCARHGTRSTGCPSVVRRWDDSCNAWASRGKKTLIAREQDAVARAQWQTDQPAIAPERLVFLDETHVPTNLTPRYGRAPRGQRVIGRVPHGRWSAITLVATMTVAGMGPGLQFDGALDRATFDQFVIQILVPVLRPGQIVVMDNLAVHKSAVARAAIAAAGCEVRFLPTYSPDFNPIELAFSHLKHSLRRRQPRTVDEIMAATQAAYPHITAHHARRSFHHAGYNL